MAEARVAELAVGSLDPAGLQVREVYARKGDEYAVYRTEKRVAVQFADLRSIAVDQRKTIIPLGMLRSEINGLIDGWRRSDRHRARARTKLYDRQCADALISAFEGDADGALAQLNAVRTRIFEGRTAIARFQYLGTAFAMVLTTYLILWLTTFPAISSSAVTTDFTGSVLVAVAGGAMGAFLSIAIVLKGRTVLPDLQWVANLSDAVLRMTVGIVASAILICLMKGGFGINFGEQTVTVFDERWMQVFAIGVFAGFFERLVPDLLEKTGAAGHAPSPPPSPPAPAPAAASAGPPTQGVTPAGPPAMADPDAEGDCLCDQPVSQDEMTPDHALPAATGGVAGDGS